MFLSPERKFKRKIKEIILARRLEEEELTKDEILELYLNKVYFGHGAYGAQMAAKTYFGKNIWEVNQAEAALLAGLPKSPTAFSPYNDIDLTKLRQSHVLKRMVAEGYLTEEQSKKIYDQPLNLENLRTQEEIAPFIVDYVRKYIEKKYGPDKLYEGGLKVDYRRRHGRSAHRGNRPQRRAPRARQAAGIPRPHRVQAAQIHADRVGFAPRHGEARRIVQCPCARGRTTSAITVKGRGMMGYIMHDDMAWALIKHKRPKDDPNEFKKPAEIIQPGDIIKVRLKAYDKKKQLASFILEQTPLVEGAVVSIEPFHGYVRALVGGYDFVEGGFNHAMDARRQPGSSFKPFIYGAALKSGFTPASILMDLPVIHREGTSTIRRGGSPRIMMNVSSGPCVCERRSRCRAMPSRSA